MNSLKPNDIIGILGGGQLGRMLAQAAAKGIYRDLLRADLTRPIDIKARAYEAIICVGAFGNGHVGPENLPEIIRIAEPGAPIVIYMNGMPYEEDDYPNHFARLEAAGLWRVERKEKSNYMSSLDRPGWLIVARRGDG